MQTCKLWRRKKVDAVVLDFRASPATNDFALAAEFAKRFCPKDKPLFTLRKTTARQERTFTSERDPSYQGLTLILADGDTAGAAEAVAGVIRIYDKALVIGQPTAGQAVEYSDLKLPSGKVLRVAVGEAILPEGRPLFPGGLKPDLPVEMAAGRKARSFSSQPRERDDAVYCREFAAALERSGADLRKESGAGSDGGGATQESQPGKERSPRRGAAARARSGDFDRDFPEEVG